MLFKQTVKRAAQHMCARIGPHNWSSRDPQLIVLMYHRILPKVDPRYFEEQPGMIVEPDTFQMHLKTAKRFFQPFKLADWIHRAAHHQSLPKKAFAVSFDDGWRDNYDYAYEQLKAEHVPATIFLVSDLVGTNHTFWPERLMKIIISANANLAPNIWQSGEFKWLIELEVSYSFDGSPPNRDELDEIVSKAKCFSDNELNSKLDAMASSSGLNIGLDKPDILDWEQINEMMSSGLVTFGSHTRQHVRMTENLDSDELEEQIIKSKQILESKTGANIDLFCYPNGDITQQADKLVRRHYKGACTTNTGWNKLNSDVFLIKRMGIHQDVAADETAFLARLSGWL